MCIAAERSVHVSLAQLQHLLLGPKTARALAGASGAVIGASQFKSYRGSACAELSVFTMRTTQPVYYKKRSQCCSPMLKIDALIWKGLNMLCHWAFYCNQAPNTGIYVLVFVTVLIAIDFRPVRSKLRHTDMRFI